MTLQLALEDRGKHKGTRGFPIYHLPFAIYHPHLTCAGRLA